jgi:hypothetical protein
MPIVWFEMVGLVSLATHHYAINHTGNRRDTEHVRPVV